MSKNPFWTAETIVEATCGSLIGPSSWNTGSFSMDSRTVQLGDVFIAIKGPLFDGHDFVAQAVQKGAVAAIVNSADIHLPSSFPLVVVPDTDAALVALGQYARRHFKGKVVGITGSCGKTSTKDMLALCLAEQAITYKSEKSFNTKWGVPFTLINCPQDASFLVLEMGMSALGEIKQLSDIARPHVAIVTNIGQAHLGSLKSIEHIVEAKSEIFEGVISGGTAIVNGDLKCSNVLLQNAKRNHIEHVFFFGEGENCHTCLLSYTVFAAGVSVQASILGEHVSYTLQSFGKHHVMNSLAVLTAIKVLKGDSQHAICTLSAFTESERRGKSYVLKDNILLVDESYNANPDSMRAALLAFNERPVRGQRFLVLGDMRELGENAVEHHKHLREILRLVKVDKLFTYGPLMKHLYHVMQKEVLCEHFDSLEDLEQSLVKVIKPNDGIFIKSSNSIKLNTIVEKLMEYYAV